MTEPTTNSVDQSQSINISLVTSTRNLGRGGPESPAGHLYGPKKLMVSSTLILVHFTRRSSSSC